MKRGKKYSFCAVCLVMLLLSACTKVKPQPEPMNECIPPEFPLAVPMGVTQAPGPRPTEIPPLGKWVTESVLPSGKSYALSIVFRPTDEIWISTPELVLKYQINIREWKTYSTIDDLPFVPGRLFLARDSTLWGAEVFKNEDETDPAQKGMDIPFFSRYNSEEDRFEFVHDRNGILLDYVLGSSPSEIEVDQNGHFWFIGYSQELSPRAGKYLYEFDPVTLLARAYDLVDGPFYWTLGLSPQGDIWLAGPEKGQLIQFIPELQGIRIRYGSTFPDDNWGNEDFRDIHMLEFDRQGRLWVEDRGWLDFTKDPEQPVWYKIVRSPVFITNYAHPESQYAWGGPREMYQSSNGLYWFNGAVRLDPETAEWCRFTTSGGPIVEDDQGNLWLAVLGNLYKLDLEP